MRRYILALCILGLCCSRGNAASTPWVEVRSPHFRVITDINDTVGGRVADRLERIRLFFQAVLPDASVDADQPITVFALQDRKSFESIEPAADRKKRSSQFQIVGFFLPTPDNNYTALQIDALFVHGYAGVYSGYVYFILRKATWMPLWLRTGLADFYENTDIDGDQILFGAPNFEDIQYVHNRLDLLPLPELLTLGPQSPFYTDADKRFLFESESWALTHYVQTSDFQKKTHHLSDYARHLMEGEDSLTAAGQSFGELPELSKRLQSYVSQSVYQGTSVRMKFDIDDRAFTSRKVPIPEVDAIRADILAHGGRQAEAEKLADDVLQEDPDNARARDVLGALAAYKRDTAGARKWYEEAARLDPNDHVAQFYAGVYSRNDPAAVDSAIAHFRQCIQLDPGFAPAYNDLADLYVTQRRNLDEARVLTMHAAQLEPQNLIYRFTAAQVLEAQHNFAVALMVLEDAKAHVARSPSQQEEIDRRMNELKQEQQASAASPAKTTP